MFRNALGGARDLYLLRSTSGQQSFGKAQKLGEGSWMLNACPMDGGGIAHAGDRTITAWRRDLDIFLAEPGRPETRLGKGHDVALAATRERTYVLWVENSELISWIDGRIETLAPKAAMPAIAVLPNGGALAAWEADGGISVATLK